MKNKIKRRILIFAIFLFIVFFALFSFFYIIKTQSLPTVEHTDNYIATPSFNYSISIKYRCEGFFCVDKKIYVEASLAILNETFFKLVNGSNLMIMIPETQPIPIDYFPDNSTPLTGGPQAKINAKTTNANCNLSYLTSGKHSYILSFVTDQAKILYSKKLQSTLEVSSSDIALQLDTENKTLQYAVAGLLLTIIGILITLLVSIKPTKPSSKKESKE